MLKNVKFIRIYAKVLFKTSKWYIYHPLAASGHNFSIKFSMNMKVDI